MIEQHYPSTKWCEGGRNELMNTTQNDLPTRTCVTFGLEMAKLSILMENNRLFLIID